MFFRTTSKRYDGIVEKNQKRAVEKRTRDREKKE